MYWKYTGKRFDSSKEYVTLSKETDMYLHTKSKLVQLTQTT